MPGTKETRTVPMSLVLIVINLLLSLQPDSAAIADTTPRLQKPTLWPADPITGVAQIPYEVRDPRPEIGAALSTAAATWNSTGRVRFYEVRLPAESTVPCGRIRVIARHPYNPNDDFCMASPGYSGREPESNYLLTGGCETGNRDNLIKLLLHELGHSAGLMHEHQRAERDEFINLVAQRSGARLSFLGQRNFAEKVNYPQRHLYGYFSIMHYPLILPENAARQMWSGEPPRDRRIFALEGSRKSIFESRHPGRRIEEIGTFEAADVTTSDRDALTALYADPGFAHAEMTHICR